MHEIQRRHLPNVECLTYSLVQDVHFALFSSGNQLLSKHVASHVPVALPVCRLWYTWRIIASQVMLTSVEAMLIIRGEQSGIVLFTRLITVDFAHSLCSI